MAGGIAVDIGGAISSSRVRSIAITRGRQDELDRTSTGTCTIELSYLDGDATGLIGQDGSVALTNPFGGDATIFVGVVDEVIFDLHHSQRYTNVSVTLVDALDFFAGIELAPGLYGEVPLPAGVDEGNIFYEQEIVGNFGGVGRIKRVVDESGFGGATEIFSGNVQLKDTVYSPRTSLLTVIDDACDAEFPGVANRFVARDGTFTFHGRLARFNPTDVQYHIVQYAAGDKAACLADPPRARVAGLRLGTSRQRIINAALATPKGIADDDIEGQIVTDSGSIDTYGTRSWSAENLLTHYDELTDLEDLDATKQFAQYYVDNYSQPQIRIEELVLKSRHPDWADAEATWTMLCNADISDMVNVNVTNPGVGVNDDFFIEGVRYQIQPLNGDYALVVMSLDLSPAAYWATPF